MQGWRFSWRAVGAWAGAALAAGLAFGLSVSALDAWGEPDQAGDFFQNVLVISVAGVALYGVIGALLFLVFSFVQPRLNWPRPWVETVLTAVFCFGLMRPNPWLDITIDNGPGLPGFLGAQIVPAACGAVLALCYYALARKRAEKSP